jgi:hypothetical protein
MIVTHEQNAALLLPTSSEVQRCVWASRVGAVSSTCVSELLIAESALFINWNFIKVESFKNFWHFQIKI